jgi:hypothetical protein
MGIEGMGKRTNCFVIVSIPHKQKEVVCSPSFYDDSDDDEPFAVYRSLTSCTTVNDSHSDPVYRSLGVSRSANVTIDKSYVCGKALNNNIAIERDESEPIVVTILLYNTLQGGKDVDTVDLALAVADMDRIYDLANDHGGAKCRLSQLPVMLHKLEAAHMKQISEVQAHNAKMAIKGTAQDTKGMSEISYVPVAFGKPIFC